MERNIHDLLEMSVEDAIAFFRDEPEIAKKLQPLSDVGLGYVKLGQSSDTLSGGEAQRVKLASFLGRGLAQENILSIFDEPTWGLHFHDISKLQASIHARYHSAHSFTVHRHNHIRIDIPAWSSKLVVER